MLDRREQKNLKHYVSEDNKRLAQVFDALSDNNRCQIFRVFTKRTNLNVSEIASLLGTSLSLTSQHLKILENSQLLIREKIGREVFYRVNEQDPIVQSIVKAILS